MKAARLLGVLLALCAAAPAAGEGSVPAVGAGGVDPAREAPLPSLRDRIERYVRARVPAAASTIEVPPLEDFVLPGAPDDVDVRLSVSPRQRFAGPVPVTVVLSRDDVELKRGVVTVRVRTPTPVAVVARPLPRGALISERDVRIERRDLATLPATAVTDAAQLLGSRTRRAVAAGAPWEIGWVERPPLIARGQLVRLRLDRGPLAIEAHGRARSDGHEGDWIRVENTASRRELVGRVSRDGTVHVEY